MRSRHTVAERTTIYFSISGGIGDWEAYAPDGHIIRSDDLPFNVIHLDWDNIEGETKDESEEEYSSTNIARAWLADETVPERVRKDIEINLAAARRWDDDE